MNTIREQDWPAQEPPLDFAARAVDAMLAPANPSAVVRPLGRPRKLMLFWVLAALFASGTALAWTWSHYHRTPDAVARMVVAPVISAPVPSSITHAIAGLSNAAPSVIASTSKPKVHATRPAMKAQSQTTEPPPKPRTPACQCERGFSDFMCDCY
jgi:hypothetical protein